MFYSLFAVDQSCINASARINVVLTTPGHQIATTVEHCQNIDVLEKMIAFAGYFYRNQDTDGLPG